MKERAEIAELENKKKRLKPTACFFIIKTIEKPLAKLIKKNYMNY